MRRMKDRAEILLDNVFRPLTVPATGGFLSAIVVFVLVFQMIAPGTTVRAVQKAVFAATFSDAPLASEPEMYQDRYLVRDILNYPAAAVADACPFNPNPSSVATRKCCSSIRVA